MIVEASADLDVLNATLSGTDDRLVTLERLHSTRRVPLRSVFWLHGNGSPSLESSLTNDPTVTDARELSRAREATLYRATHPESLPLVDTHEAAVAADVLLLDAVGDAEGWSMKFWMPDRQCLSTFREDCQRTGLTLQVNSMYNDDPQPVGDLYGLTERQREILLLAAQSGYFQIPREITLADLAAEIDLSSQAASERLRRGMRTLVDNVLADSSPLAGGRLGPDTDPWE